MKICFVSLNIYSLFRPEVNRLVGGAELQQKYLGEELQNLSFSVSYIVFDHGQPNGETIAGFSFYKAFSPHEGMKGVRFFHPRLTKLWRALKEADADIYYCRCAGWQVGVVAYFAKKFGRKFVYAGAHNSNFVTPEKLPLGWRDRYLYLWGLKNADLIVCQTPYQKQMLQNNYYLKGYWQPNVCPSAPVACEESPQELLWVSHIHQHKRPTWFVELAARFPEKSFTMIGGAKGGQEKLFGEIKKRVAELSNLKFIGWLPLPEVEKYLNRARVLFNTSQEEGFPNTYLQAWRRGIPVITTFDPNLAIEEQQLGWVARDQEELYYKTQRFFQGVCCHQPEQIQQICQERYGKEKVVAALAERLFTL